MSSSISEFSEIDSWEAARNARLSQIRSQIEEEEKELTFGLTLPDELTDEKLKKLLECFNSFLSVKLNWKEHIYTLTKLEITFKKSTTFTLQKAIGLFQGHIEQLQKSGFEINKFYPIKKANEQENDKYETYLGVAATHLCPALVQALINSRADVKKGEKDSDFSPLDLMVRGTYNHDRAAANTCIKLLAANGCNPNGFKLDNYIPPLGLAALGNNADLMNSLIQAKADINWKNDGYMWQMEDGNWDHNTFTIPGCELQPLNFLEMALFRKVPNIDAVNLLFSAGIDLFATNIIETILNDPKVLSILGVEFNEPLCKLLSHKSITYITQVKETVNSFILVSVLTDIVAGYLFPPLASLQFPPSEGKKS